MTSLYRYTQKDVLWIHLRSSHRIYRSTLSSSTIGSIDPPSVVVLEVLVLQGPEPIHLGDKAVAQLLNLYDENMMHFTRCARWDQLSSRPCPAHLGPLPSPPPSYLPRPLPTCPAPFLPTPPPSAICLILTHLLLHAEQLVLGAARRLLSCLQPTMAALTHLGRGCEQVWMGVVRDPDAPLRRGRGDSPL